jgi:vacuolar-type H+-ATPase subunit I/STV1
MGILEDAKKALDTVNTFTEKVDKKLTKEPKKYNKNIWFLVSAIAIQVLAVIIPMAVITTLNDAWQKTGLGFGIIVILFGLLVIFWRYIKLFNKMAPGVLVFGIIFVVAFALNTTMETIMIVTGSGLLGSVGAMPLHILYTNKQKEKEKSEETPEVKAIKDLTAVLIGKSDKNIIE